MANTKQNVIYFCLDQYSAAMIQHIQFYTIGQYKDYPEDEATFYTVADCLWQMRKYERRWGSNQRQGQDRLDMLKLGHYAAMTAAKVYGQDLDMENRPRGMSYRAHEWCVVLGWLKQAISNNELPAAGEKPAPESSPDDIIKRIERTLRLVTKTEAGATVPRMLRIIYYAAMAWNKIPEGNAEDVPFVKVKRMHPDARLPAVKTGGSVGADLAAAEAYTVAPQEIVLVRTGIAMEIPEGYEGQVRARGGVSTKKQLLLINGVGTIDWDYRGEVIVPLKNLDRQRQEILPGDRIAQILIMPAPRFEFYWSEDLSETERGAGGFGSTGTN